MSVILNYNNMMEYVIGEQGITETEISEHKDFAMRALASVESGRGKAMQGWMDSPHNQDEVVHRICQVAERIQSEFDTFVVLGIGGSALGPIAVFNALKHLYYNELSSKQRRTPKFYVIDNVDPERMNALFDIINLETTVFNVITKSGATSETMSQYLIVMDMLKQKYRHKARKHIIATTSETKGNLIQLAEDEGFETFYIPEGVGGRFSELCPVGLLPAAVVGIDIAEMLRGAREMDKLCADSDLYSNPALMSALLQYLSMKKGKNISVMMPYADSLKYIADWYCQLWAESLGKAHDKSGNIVNVGQTPVKSLGVTDQHSQVQLYAEGPYDKVITFIEVKNFRNEMPIPFGCEQFPNVNFLCGHTLNELMSKELYATRYALTKQNRANYTIILDTVDEYHIGALLYMLQLQTAYAGAMLGIDAYDQPGVEEGKNATYALFGREGYEEKAAELANCKPDSDKYII
ncbi:MAG: glucose-6-phosphate isomerase [Corallococcus sp.]|nr:glucose-6-phosphate isomerase [Corallococcus sp.]